MEMKMISTVNNRAEAWALVEKKTDNIVGVYSSRTLARQYKHDDLTIRRALVTLV